MEVLYTRSECCSQGQMPKFYLCTIDQEAARGSHDTSYSSPPECPPEPDRKAWLLNTQHTLNERHREIKPKTRTNMEAYLLWLPERYYAGCWDGKAIKCTHAVHPVCYSDGLAERYPHRGSSGMTIPRGANYFLVDGYCVIYCSILKHSGRG